MTASRRDFIVGAVAMTLAPAIAIAKGEPIVPLNATALVFTITRQTLIEIGPRIYDGPFWRSTDLFDYIAHEYSDYKLDHDGWRSLVRKHFDTVMVDESLETDMLTISFTRTLDA